MLCNFVNREYLSSSVVFILYNLGKIDDAKLYHENGNYKNDNENDNLIFEIDPTTEEAARNVAITYDRLGFILKHDKELEDEFIQWQSYVIADMWLFTKDLVNKKWRSRNKNYLKEFE